jgi:hypothetical protein
MHAKKSNFASGVSMVIFAKVSKKSKLPIMGAFDFSAEVVEDGLRANP